jgi:hypothetical protein
VTIPHDHFHGRPDEARSFVNSTNGTLLHEIGHFVGWNDEFPIHGHIIVSCSDGGGGAFSLTMASVGHVERGRLPKDFPIAAACVTEIYFCNYTNLSRNASDIASYCTEIPTFGSYSAEEIACKWRNRFLDRVVRLADVIEHNYRKCSPFLVDNRYRIDGHHVIPSWILRVPHTRWPPAWIDEMLWTASESARRKALEDYLEASARRKFIRGYF